MNKKAIDLTDIKELDNDKTSSFTDIMSRTERKKRQQEKTKEDREFMLDDEKSKTEELSVELEKAKKEYKKNIDDNEEELSKTQLLELTKQMKFNFEETKKENAIKKKNGISVLNVIGEVNLLCIGYYIYLLVFTNYQDNKTSYMITGGIIVGLVLLFGLSVVTSKKLSKFFNILNILTILAFIAFNTYSLLN